MLHIENAVCSLNSHHCLFLAVFLVVCTVTVRNIKADSDEHFFRHRETNTFVPLTAQSFRSKDKATLDQHMLHTLKDQLFLALTCIFIFYTPQSYTCDLKFIADFHPLPPFLNSLILEVGNLTRVGNSTFANYFTILPLRTWKFDQKSCDTTASEVTAFTSAAAKDPYVAPQSHNNEWSN